MDAQNSRVGVSCLLAGSWLNTVLFTLEIVLCFLYMRRWKLDPVFHYGFVLFLVNDTLGTLCVYANSFLSFVQRTENPKWPAAVLLISTALSALIEQTFLVHRYWMVTKNTVWSGIIMLIALAHMCAAISSVALGGPSKEFSVHNGLTLVRPPALTILTCLKIFRPHVLIALSMVWSLSGFDSVSQSTRHLIRSIALNALATGAVVASVTGLAMITLLIKSLDRNIFSLFFVIMGRVYSLTIIVNFYQRHRQQAIVSNAMHVSAVSLPESQFVVESLPTTTRGTLEVRTAGRTTRDSRSTERTSPKDEFPSGTAPPRPSRVPALYTSASHSEA
ncbi:hypothetical protein MVEN_00356800 [Mycena venus]|uniref:Transmembrane protein n=1 Tax=Mycena venus TaxID=2733690 RepID=A0A8H6YW11_9AGAR|nr:hypothetical protein MVEN_00356800 [Mycena venus]